MKKKATRYPAVSASLPAALKEASGVPGVGLTLSVRAARNHLSALLEWVSGGQEVTITSAGKPKAVLVPVGSKGTRKVFTGTWKHLEKMPPWRGGQTSEVTVRADRDGRG